MNGLLFVGGILFLLYICDRLPVCLDNWINESWFSDTSRVER